MRRTRTLAISAALLSAIGIGWAQDEQFGFMPPGGRVLLLGVLGNADGETLAETAAMDRSAEEWRNWAIAQGAELNETALDTLAGYAELNLPLGEDVLQELSKTGDPGLLPQDGKDLAIAQCQFCHSLFTGYLMHDRDEIGWKAVFKAPFHKGIPMTEVQRDTFARYSALNMPVNIQDVPPELRF